MSKVRRSIENHLLIENKQRQLVRFKLNKIQAKYDINRTNRDIILKARQEGFSSLIIAEFVIDCLSTPNTKSVIISHSTEATQRLLQRARLYIERFYDGDEFIPIKLKYNSKSEIYFPEMNSTMYIGTAGAKSFGRGDVINNLHLSELAFYEDPQEFLTGIIPAVPDEGRIVIETTANGFNYMKEFWERSKQGLTDFKPHFYAWWEHDEYNRRGKVHNKTDYELGLQERFGLTDGQLQWRRYKLKQFPEEEMFKQEYPSDEFEAFISSGRPVFNQEILKEYYAKAKDPVTQGYVNEVGHFTKDEKGYVKVWEWPQDSEASYVIGADVAEGLEHGDYSTAVVLDRKSFEVVATWHGHIDPDAFADELIGLSRMFNGASIGCEVNNHGLVVNLKIRERGYPALYRRQRLDKITKVPTSELGWKTDMKTKPLMIDDLAQAIRERSLVIKDKETIYELLSYERDEKGKTNAAKSMFDDRVIALAIAIQMRQLTSQINIQLIKEVNTKSAEYIFDKAIKERENA